MLKVIILRQSTRNLVIQFQLSVCVKDISKVIIIHQSINQLYLVWTCLGPAGEEAVGVIEKDGLPVGYEVHLGLQTQHLCLLPVGTGLARI